MIYNLLMPYVKKMYVTEIHKEYEGDAVFPRIDDTKWEEIERIKENPDYDFVTYQRKN